MDLPVQSVLALIKLYFNWPVLVILNLVHFQSFVYSTLGTTAVKKSPIKTAILLPNAYANSRDWNYDHFARISATFHMCTTLKCRCWLKVAFDLFVFGLCCIQERLSKSSCLNSFRLILLLPQISYHICCIQYKLFFINADILTYQVYFYLGLDWLF